jgi:hypothetical protein
MNRKGRRRAKHTAIDAKLASADMHIASYPLPCKTIEWAGKTSKAVSSSGAPIKVEGMISRKVCDIAAAIIKIHKYTPMPAADKTARRNMAILFVCNPGMMPVTAPINAPATAKDMTNMKSIIAFHSMKWLTDFQIKIAILRVVKK